jgi:hypothetical protein
MFELATCQQSAYAGVQKTLDWIPAFTGMTATKRDEMMRGDDDAL